MQPSYQSPVSIRHTFTHKKASLLKITWSYRGRPPPPPPLDQWRRSQVKSGDKYWEDWRGGVWGGTMPSQLGSGACPQKKNQFCAKNYPILRKFWYFFPIYYSRKWGDYPPSPESGGTYPPVPPAPTPMPWIRH